VRADIQPRRGAGAGFKAIAYVNKTKTRELKQDQQTLTKLRASLVDYQRRYGC